VTTGGQRGNPWGSALPELGIAGVALGACAATAFAVAGWAASVLVVVVFCAAALVIADRLLASSTVDKTVPKLSRDGGRTGGSSISLWPWPARLKFGVSSMSSYQADLGQRLEHLLAAKLSEKYGISLYADPDAARRILCRDGKDADLWAWVEPGRPPAASLEARGIPVSSLARLLKRLEQL